MRFVSVSEARKRLDDVLDQAQREPVTIRHQNREVAVVLSPPDHRRLTAANVVEFQRFCDRVSDVARARRRAIGRGGQVPATGPCTVGRCTHGRFPTWIGEIA